MKLHIEADSFRVYVQDSILYVDAFMVAYATGSIEFDSFFLENPL